MNFYKLHNELIIDSIILFDGTRLEIANLEYFIKLFREDNSEYINSDIDLVNYFKLLVLTLNNLFDLQSDITHEFSLTFIDKFYGRY